MGKPLQRLLVGKRSYRLGSLRSSKSCRISDYHVGALPNSHIYLNNLGGGFTTVVPYDNSVVVRAIDPGAGAFSYYMGRHTIAENRDMTAGEEIFLEYPKDSMDFIIEKYSVPNNQDYEEAERWPSMILEHDVRSIDRNNVPSFIQSALLIWCWPWPEKSPSRNEALNG